MSIETISPIIMEQAPKMDFSTLSTALSSLTTLSIIVIGWIVKVKLYDPKKNNFTTENTGNEKSLYSQYKYETNELIRVEISNLIKEVTSKMNASNTSNADKFIKSLLELKEDKKMTSSSFASIHASFDKYKLEMKQELKEMREGFIHKDNCASKMLSKRDIG